MTTISTIRVNVYYTGTYGESVDAIASSAGCSGNGVDRCNSDGTGVAALTCPADQLDYLCEMLDEAGDEIDSYKILN